MTTLKKPKVIEVKKAPKKDFIVDVKPTTEPVVEMYNGKKVIGKGTVEINGVIHKTITTEEGSTYTI